jgi:hypothetical protein
VAAPVCAIRITMMLGLRLAGFVSVFVRIAVSIPIIALLATLAGLWPVTSVSAILEPMKTCS